MTAQEILEHLYGMGFALAPLDDEKIEVRPRQILTDEIRALIRRHKAELLQYLTGRNQGNKPVQGEGYGCGRCGNKVYLQVTIGENQPLPPGGE